MYICQIYNKKNDANFRLFSRQTQEVVVPKEI